MTQPAPVHRPSRRRRAAQLGVLAAILGCLPGCAILGFGGAMVDSYRRNSTKTVKGEYNGLKGKNWAVVIIADRSVQAEFSDLVPWLSGKISERLTDEQSKIAAAGMVPSARVLRYTYDHPSWVTMPYSELARELQVNRLIVVEITEYRLNDPGNQYLWAGHASGTVGVVEADTSMPDEFAFEKSIRVRFPDDDSYGQNDIGRPTVATALGQRFLDRVTWLFYSHQEPYYPKY
jgi:hypothetical protein